MNLFNSKYILNGKKRHAWIDYDRGISIILVTYRHCIEGLIKSGINLKSYPILEYMNVFLFGFRMPLFFIASGIFLSASLNKKGLNGYTFDRFKTILYPMLIWGIIQISLQILFSDYTNSKDNVNFNSFYYLITNPRATGQFWYLNALFFVGIIYSILNVFFKFNKNHQLFLGILFYTLCAYSNAQGYHLGFISDILKYYLFFALGDAISSVMLSENASKFFTSWKLILPLAISFILIQYFFTKINLLNNDNYFVENKMPLFFIVVALVGCAISISLSFTLKKYEKFSFLRVLGYNSVHIYCMQIIVMAIFRLLFIKSHLITSVPLLTFMILLSGLIVPVIIYNYCLRLNLWWLFTLKKPIAEIDFVKQQVG